MSNEEAREVGKRVSHNINYSIALIALCSFVYFWYMNSFWFGATVFACIAIGLLSIVHIIVTMLIIVVYILKIKKERKAGKR